MAARAFDRGGVEGGDSCSIDVGAVSPRPAGNENSGARRARAMTGDRRALGGRRPAERAARVAARASGRHASSN